MSQTQWLRYGLAGLGVLLAAWSIATATGTLDLIRTLVLIVTAIILIIQARR